ncbi:MAG: gluconokinase [Pseudomonadota bacterium]
MGVAGSGKSTLGESLAQEFAWPYRDADSFHPQVNIDKMSRGEALSDDDRWPWLDAIAAWMDERRLKDLRAIVSCSALKRVYRDRLLKGRADVRLVYLAGTQEVIGRRMSQREGHFMPTALLDSQFAALEEPTSDENPIVVPIDSTPRRIAEAILSEFAQSGDIQT